MTGPDAPRLDTLFDEVRERLSRVFGQRITGTDGSISPPGWGTRHRVESVLMAALELRSTERAAFLDRVRADEPGMRVEVESLLAAHTRHGILDPSSAEGMGEYGRAKACLEEALQMTENAREVDPDSFMPDSFTIKSSYVLHNLANVHRALGNNERALEYLRRSVAFGSGKRLPVQLSYHHTSIAHIHLQQGRIEDSLRRYREAVELTRKAKFAAQNTRRRCGSTSEHSPYSGIQAMSGPLS